MKPEEILDWQSESPQEYYANILAQAKHELSQEFNRTFEQRRSEDAIVATYENFAKQNPDFDSMWDDGVLQEFMRNNPGHNAISAYHAITAESKAKDLDTKVQEAGKKAAKEAEEQFIKNQRAKRTSDVLRQGPSAPGSVSLNETSSTSRTRPFSTCAASTTTPSATPTRCSSSWCATSAPTA